MERPLAAPLRRLERDVRQFADLTLVTLDEPWSDLPGVDSMWLVSRSGSMTGIHLCENGQVEEQTVDLAVQVQDFVHEELIFLRRPVAWPPCPLHPDSHPLSPVLKGAQAWWQCSKERRALRPIGGPTRAQ